MKYVFPAVFYEEKDGGYFVEFPDVKGVLTQGKTLFEALDRAEDALSLMLVSMEDDNNKIAEPTPLDKVVAQPAEYATKYFVNLIKADTDAYRSKL